MRWLGWLGALALGWAGCAAPAQDRVRAYNEDGVFLYQRGDYAGARDTFLAALALQPEDPGLLYNAGQCYDRLGDATKSENYYNLCLQRVPNHPAARHALTVLLVRTNRRDQAERMVQDWQAHQPELSSPYAEYGWLWRTRGDLLQAQAYLQRALELDPRDQRALIELGILYETMHRPDRAIALYERVLEQEPRHAEVTERLNLLQAQGATRPQPD